MADFDVIVIGSGIGGLSAALTCARAGRRVLVLEAAKQLGGFINPFARKHYWFDTGIHYIGEAGPGQPLRWNLERMGLMDSLEFRELDPNGFDRYVFPDYEVRMCKGVDAYCARLVKDFPHERSGLTRFFERVKQTGELLRLANKAKVSTLPKLLGHAPLLLRYHRATFARLLEDCIGDPRLRSVLAGPCGDMGLPPSKVTALGMLALLAHFLPGAYFPRGGSRAVRDAYVDSLKAHGATLMRNTRVERILTRDGRVRGVRTADGKEHTSPTVVSNADIQVTLETLLGTQHCSRRLNRKLDRYEGSLGSLCLFVGTDLQPQDHGLDAANVWHYPDWNIDALYDQPLTSDAKLPFFLTVPTLKDPEGSHAPPGKHVVELITFSAYAPFDRWADQKPMKRDREYVEFKQKLQDRLLDAAEGYLPQLRQHVEVMETATPVTNLAFVNVPGGAIYGPAHTPAQFGLYRFGVRGPVRGLFLCGSGVFGAGIASCVASGVLAGRLALQAERDAVPKSIQVLRNVRPASAGQ